MKIDFHTHIIPEQIPNFKQQFGYGGFITLDKHTNKTNMNLDNGTFFRAIECNCYDVPTRLSECDQCNVNVQVISTVPIMFSYWAKPNDTLQVCQFINNHIAEICKNNPHRFIGLGTLPMNDIKLAIQEAERCTKELKLKGFQIGTHVNGINLDDPQFYPLYEKLEDLKSLIFVHPWDMLGKERMTKYWMEWLVGMPCETSVAMCSILFGGINIKYPNLKFIFSHGGGSFICTLGRIKHGHEVRPDLFSEKISFTDFKNIYVDSLVHDIDILKKLIKEIGSSNIVLGSDYPFPLGEKYPGSLIESSDINDNDKEKILWRNAADLLNLNI